MKISQSLKSLSTNNKAKNSNQRLSSILREEAMLRHYFQRSQSITKKPGTKIDTHKSKEIFSRMEKTPQKAIKILIIKSSSKRTRAPKARTVQHPERLNPKRSPTSKLSPKSRRKIRRTMPAFSLKVRHL